MDLVRLELVKKLAILWRAEPTNNFSIDAWNCGTTLCIMGKAGTLKTFNDMGFRTHGPEWAKFHTQGQVEYVRGNDRFFNFDAVEKFFDIDERTAVYLFGASVNAEFPPADTLNEIISRLDEVMEGRFV